MRLEISTSLGLVEFDFREFLSKVRLDFGLMSCTSGLCRALRACVVGCARARVKMDARACARVETGVSLRASEVASARVRARVDMRARARVRRWARLRARIWR